jgi:hypothetical protein
MQTEEFVAEARGSSETHSSSERGKIMWSFGRRSISKEKIASCAKTTKGKPSSYTLASTLAEDVGRRHSTTTGGDSLNASRLLEQCDLLKERSMPSHICRS